MGKKHVAVVPERETLRANGELDVTDATPSITITAPSDGQTVSGLTSVAVTATVENITTAVAVFQDPDSGDTYQPTATTAPTGSDTTWTFSFDLSGLPQTCTLVLTVYSADADVSQSINVTVVPDLPVGDDTLNINFPPSSLPAPGPAPMSLPGTSTTFIARGTKSPPNAIVGGVLLQGTTVVQYGDRLPAAPRRWRLLFTRPTTNGTYTLRVYHMIGGRRRKATSVTFTIP
jgi:hypothetical protein